MEKFGKGLSAALKTQNFRQLIKNEAIKKFNGDTDVLYQLIKNQPIGDVYMKKSGVTVEGANTFHDFLIPFFSSEQELNAFESKMPTLTVFVPELPENSFSAENWDINDENQIPDVALRLDNITYVPVIGRDDDNYLIAPEDVPSWAVVVVKENERMTASTDASYNSLNTRVISSTEGIDFKFSSNNFDPQFTSFSDGFVGATDNNIPQYLKTGYDVFAANPFVNWQRDNIYYGLTPGTTTGAISGGKYREHIVTFRMNASTPMASYLAIADSFNEVKRDPLLRQTWQRGNPTAWTEGNFEFSVNCFYGAKGANLGLSLEQKLPCTPNDLFNISWESRTTGWWFWRKTWFRPIISGVKTMNTAVPGRTRLAFATWNLNEFSNVWRYVFDEIDASTTTVTSETNTVKFNANISMDTKIGLKFGASGETTNTNSWAVTVIAGNDALGAFVLPFWDNPINMVNGQYRLRRYTTSLIEVSVAPLQVQF